MARFIIDSLEREKDKKKSEKITLTSLFKVGKIVSTGSILPV
jgi:ribosome-associated protein YbcJ (S4-like RNA binding protein)